MLLLQKYPHKPLGLWSGHLSSALHVQLPRMLRPRVVRTNGFSDHVKEKIFTQRRNCLGHQYPINFYGLPINFIVKFLTYQNHLSFFIFYLFFCEMNFNAAILPLKEFFLLFPIFLCPAERLTHEQTAFQCFFHHKTSNCCPVDYKYAQHAHRGECLKKDPAFSICHFTPRMPHQVPPKCLRN